MLASLGPLAERVPDGFSRKQWHLLDLAWQVWEEVHGLAWRVQRGYPHNVDVLDLAEVPKDPGSGQYERANAVHLRERLDELTEHFWEREEIAGRHRRDEPVPDPPGFEVTTGEDVSPERVYERALDVVRGHEDVLQRVVEERKRHKGEDVFARLERRDAERRERERSA